MIFTAMITATMCIVFMFMLMVAAMNLRVIVQRTAEQCVYSTVSLSCNSAVKFDSRLCESRLCAASDSSAN